MQSTVTNAVSSEEPAATGPCSLMRYLINSLRHILRGTNAAICSFDVSCSLLCYAWWPKYTDNGTDWMHKECSFLLYQNQREQSFTIPLLFVFFPSEFRSWLLGFTPIQPKEHQ